MSTNKSMIVLQENSGQVPLDPSVSPQLRDAIITMIDHLAETFEDIKTLLQSAGRYDTVHLLTDNACSRSNLLNALIPETRKGRIIDLIVLGHGSPEVLNLKRSPNLTGGAQGNVRTLLADARRRGQDHFNLRMVYMCNCYGSTLNDDWLSIGADVSVGSNQLDMMPEPMTTFFIHNWLNGQPARDAARNAYQATIPFYTPFYPPTLRPRYKTVSVPYPCPTVTDWFRVCSHDVQINDGVDVIEHSYIRQTELVVGGDGNCRY